MLMHTRGMVGLVQGQQGYLLLLSNNELRFHGPAKTTAGDRPHLGGAYLLNLKTGQGWKWMVRAFWGEGSDSFSVVPSDRMGGTGH